MIYLVLYTGSETVDNGLDSWKSLVATTLLLLMLLLYFTLFEYLGSLGRGDSSLVHSAKLIKLNCLVLYSYKFILFYLIFNIVTFLIFMYTCMYCKPNVFFFLIN